jgi:hypothetical protein
MRDVLTTCVAVRAPDQRAIYQALYGVFAAAFRDIDGVIFPQDRPSLTPPHACRSAWMRPKCRWWAESGRTPNSA